MTPVTKAQKLIDKVMLRSSFHSQHLHHFRSTPRGRQCNIFASLAWVWLSLIWRNEQYIAIE